MGVDGVADAAGGGGEVAEVALEGVGEGAVELGGFGFEIMEIKIQCGELAKEFGGAGEHGARDEMGVGIGGVAV